MTILSLASHANKIACSQTALRTQLECPEDG